MYKLSELGKLAALEDELGDSVKLGVLVRLNDLQDMLDELLNYWMFWVGSISSRMKWMSRIF